MKLSDYKINQVGVIKEILENKLSGNLFEFGILPGATFRIISKAPFKGPIFIQVDQIRVALRRKEAAFIIVE